MIFLISKPICVFLNDIVLKLFDYFRWILVWYLDSLHERLFFAGGAQPQWFCRFEYRPLRGGGNPSNDDSAIFFFFSFFISVLAYCLDHGETTVQLAEDMGS